jgi:CheY-like chemotaxis protein
MKTILFADDNRNIREYCRASFEDQGYRVLLACDGFEALRVFSAEAPDLTILDISMPRANGLETLERIRGLAPDAPVILFTAHDEDCLRDRRAMLATACVGKSEDLSELMQVVHRAFGALASEDRLGPVRIGLPPLYSKVSGSH